MSKRYAFGAFFVVAVALFFGLHFAFIGTNQGGTAHGQQGASLALAEGFVQNDLNFFQPQTRVLNYKSGEFRFRSKDTSGITAAHFPIHGYLPAIVHKVTSWKLSSIVQWYNLLWGFLGLLFVYLLSLRTTQNIGKSLFIVVFVATAPVFAFYQSNFLPELPSIASVFIGVYYLYCHQISGIQKNAWLSLGFLSLASLCSPDLILYAIGASGVLLYSMHKTGSLHWKNICLIGVFFLPFLLSEWHFYAMKSEYGSQFAGILEDWDYDQSSANTLFGSWKMHYFTVFQSVVLALTIIVVLIQWIKKVVLINTEQVGKFRFAICVFPAVFYALVSPFQSYYFDVFFLKFLLPFSILGLIFIIDLLNLGFCYRYPKLGIVGLILLLVILLSEGNWTQTVRHEKKRTSPGNNLAFAFRGGDELLLRHGVQPKDALAVVVPRDWGIGQEVLAHLNHEGTIWEAPPTRGDIQKFPKGHYVVCHIEERPHLYLHFKTNFTELGDNGSIVLFRAID